MKKQRIISIICIMAFLLAGCGRTVESRSEAGLPKIVIGNEDYPPFNYIDADGNFTGITVELATEAFARMGYQTEFSCIDWEKKTQLLENGEIDCIWDCFPMDGWEDLYQWAGPYMVSRQMIAVLPGSDIYTLQDLEGRAVAVQSATQPEEMFSDPEVYGLPKLKELFSLSNRELIYPFLSKGYADAICSHETFIRQYMADYNLEYRLLEEPLLTVGLGVAFAKEDDRGLAQQLDQILQEMREDGTTARVLTKYLGESEKYLGVSAYEK